MKSKYNCSVRLFFESEEGAKNAAAALGPDLDSKHNKRSETKIKVNKGVLSLNIKAVDAVALRASMNSSLKLLALVEKVSEVE